MSREIDERVVQMKFENGQFERGVQTSIKSMKQLNASMDFDNAIKGFQGLDKAAKEVDIGALNKAIDRVNSQFTLLGKIAYKELDRIANKALDTGERLLKALSTEQITAGFSKFGDKTSAVQTIMAATAKDFEDTGVQMAYVNDQISKLNWFTDETSYNFLDMVGNIGKFTANNIDLETSVTAMQGIATWAAISGANVNEASRAMYNMSQAMSAGSMKLLDWRSIENANMGTTEFKQTALEMAESLGRLKRVGEDTFSTLDGKITISAKTFTGFQDSLKKGWFDTRVMEATLNKYGAATNALFEIYEKLDERVPTSSILTVINDYLDGIDKVRKESETLGLSAEATAAKVSEKGQEVAQQVAEEWDISLEEATELLAQFDDETMRFGLKAFQAAQEAKTFSEAIDSVKDAVSTGWMNTFEIIFGDYMQAKEFWTNIANSLYTIFAESGNARNEMLKQWAEAGGRNYFIASIYNMLAAIQNVLSTIGEAWRQAFGPITSGMLYNASKALYEFTSRLVMDQETVNKFGRALRGLFSIFDILKTLLFGGVRTAFKLVHAAMGEMNIDILGFLANVGDVIFAFRNWVHESEILTNLVNGLASVIAKGMQNLRFLIKMFWQLPAVQGALSLAFGIIVGIINDVGNAASHVKKIFSDFLDYLRNSNFKISSFDDFLAFMRMFYTQLIKPLFNLEVLFPTVAAVIHNAMERIRDALSVLEGPLATVRDLFMKAASIVKEFAVNINAADVALLAIGVSIFLLLKNFTKVLKSLSGGFKTFFGLVKGVEKAVYGYLRGKNMLNYAKAILVLTAAIAVLATIDEDRLWGSVAAIGALAAGIAAFSFAMSKVQGKEGVTNTAAIAALAVAILALSASLAIIDTDDVLARLGVLTVIVTEALAASFIISKFAPNLKKGAATILAFAVAVRILVSAVKTLGGTDGKELTAGVLAVGALLTAMGLFMRLMGTSKTAVMAGDNSNVKVVNKTAAGILGLAVGLHVMILAIKSFSNLNAKQAIVGIGLMGVVLLELGAFFKIATKIGAQPLKAGGTILALATALNLMVPAIRGLAKLDKNTMHTATTNITTIGLIFVAAIAASKLAGENAHKAGLMLIEMSAALAILPMIVRILGGMDQAKLKQGLIAITVLGGIFVAAIYSSKNAEKATGALGVITAAIAILAYAVYQIAKLEPERALSSAASLSMVMLSLTAVFKSIQKMKLNEDIVGSVVIMIGLVAAVGLVIAELSRIVDDVWSAIGISAALAILLPSLGFAMKQLSGFKSISKTATKQLAVMVGVVAAIGGVITALVYIGGGELATAMTIAASIAILLPVITGCFAVLSKFKLKLRKSTATQFAAIGVIIAALGGAIAMIANSTSLEEMTRAKPIILSIYAVLPAIIGTFAILSKAKLKLRKGTAKEFAAMSGIAVAIGGLIAAFGHIAPGGVAKTITIAASIAVLMPILTNCFNKLRGSKAKIDNKLLKQFAMFGVVAAAIGGVIAAISNIPQPDLLRSITVAGTIAVLMPILTNCFNSIRGSKSKLDWKTVLEFGVMAAIAGALGAVVAVVGMIPGVDKAITVALSLAVLLPILAGVVGAIAVLPVGPDIILKAAEFGAAMDVLFGVVAIAVAGFGWLADNIGWIGDGINGAVEWFPKIGQAFGGLIGGFAGGIMGGLSSVLPYVGECLSRFMENAQGFFDGLRDISGDMLWNAAGLIGILALFSGAEFVSFIAAFPEMARNFLEDMGLVKSFGQKMKELGDAVKTFGDSLGDVDIERVRNAGEVVKVLASAESSIGLSGGFIDMIATKDLGDFGTRLIRFGSGLAWFSKIVKDIDASSVEGAANAGALLAGLESKVGASGAIIDFFGTKDLGDFGTRLVRFGVGLVEFAIITKDITPECVEGAANAGEILAKLESSLEPSKPVIDFFGTKSLGDFGARLKDFADGLVDFADKVENITAESVQGAVNAGELLVALENTLGTHGGLQSMIFGDDDLETFGDSLTGFGLGLARFYQVISLIDFQKIEDATDSLKHLLEVGEGIKDVAKWKYKILAALDQFYAVFTTNFEDRKKVFRQNGSNIAYWTIEGFGTGVYNNKELLGKYATLLADTVDRAIRDRLGIHSPSVAMIEIGHYVVQGLAEGIDKDTSAEDAATKKAQNIANAFKGIFDEMGIRSTKTDLEYKLWELTEGKDANDAEKEAKQIELKVKELEYGAEKVRIQGAKLAALEAQFGKDSIEWREANNDYLQYQIDMLTKQQEVDEMIKNASKINYEDRREQMKAYAEFQKENEEAYKMAGLSNEKLLEDARKYAKIDWITDTGDADWLLDKTTIDYDKYLSPEKAAYDTAAIVASAYEEAIIEFAPTIEEETKKNVGKSAASGVSAAAAIAADVADTEHKGMLDRLTDFCAENGLTISEESKAAVENALYNLQNGLTPEIQGVAFKLGEWLPFSFFKGETDPQAQAAVSQGAVDTANNATGAIDEALENNGDYSGATYLDGIQIANGLAKGMGSRVASSAVSTAAQGLVNIVKTQMEAEAKIASPSKVTTRYGMYIAQGLANGMRDGTPYAENSAEYLANNTLSALDQAKDLIQQVLSNEDDFSPVITPVIDFDSLEKQARGVSGVLGRQGINVSGVNTRANRIVTASDSFNGQNGSSNGQGSTTYSFTQNNYSPKALSRAEIYRQTRNQFSQLKGATKR